ncbi:MAG TPA: hypothetical protein VGM29_08570 [Polyangiaceae bacterium]|jgi:hypothetical protein
MEPKYSSAQRALAEALRTVKEVLDIEDVSSDGAQATFEGPVPWRAVLQIMADVGVDDPQEPPGSEAELWAVTFPNVPSQGFVNVTLAFGADGQLCAAGMQAD